MAQGILPETATVSYVVRSAPTEQEIIYPESDGKHKAETDIHRDLMTDLISTLKNYFIARSDVYVLGN